MNIDENIDINFPIGPPVLRRSHKAYCIYCHCITNVVNPNMRKNRICEFCKEKRSAFKIINRNCLKYIMKKRYKKITPIVVENVIDSINANIDSFYISEMISDYF